VSIFEVCWKRSLVNCTKNVQRSTFNFQASHLISDGNCDLDLPAFHRIEDRQDPKKDLWGVLITASGFRGRRQKKFNHSQALSRIVDFIEDFSPPRQLAAFRALEATVEDLSHHNRRPGFYGPN